MKGGAWVKFFLLEDGCCEQGRTCLVFRFFPGKSALGKGWGLGGRGPPLAPAEGFPFPQSYTV